MGDLWGTSGGPASQRMDPDELRKRLTVMRAYLEHESFEILPSDDVGLPGTEDVRRFNVRLTRAGCTPVVPFTLTRWHDGWLVSSIDLSAVGNPAQRCSRGN